MPLTIQRSHRVLVLALAVYWLAMFAGTHVPKPPELILHANDKLCHFAGHAGLAFLLVSWWQLSPPASRRTPAKIIAIVMTIVTAYGAFDEITQIPVGRDCQVLDWVADVSGGALGALLATIAFAVRRSLRPTSLPPDP